MLFVLGPAFGDNELEWKIVLAIWETGKEIREGAVRFKIEMQLFGFLFLFFNVI